MQQYPFKDLQPAGIWQYFHEICQVPRPSKKEERIRAYLVDFAQKQGLEVREDAIGNILIKKAGTGGLEDRPPVVLQSHIDRSEEHTSELQSRPHLVCRLLLEKKKNR